jgi:aspartokinase-like uncharacterized kinase
VVRDLDGGHGLGEELSHWLALRALSLNAWFLADLLEARRPAVTAEIESWPTLWEECKTPIVDAYRFFQLDDRQPGSLPHCWQVTSDSLAARIATVVGAGKLILLKSITTDPATSWVAASHLGWVDPYFPRAICEPETGGRTRFEVQLINLRAWRPASTPSQIQTVAGRG